jgi:hypothetical protein
MRASMMTAAVAVLLFFSAGCSHRAPTERDLFNVDAALPKGLPMQPLEWRVIASSVDREQHTMATLFGNGAAVTSARSETGTVTLVTWAQKDDGHWFGARIPRRFVSMEVVAVTRDVDGKTTPTYERFGPDGQRASTSDQDALRQGAILAERASFMP